MNFGLASSSIVSRMVLHQRRSKRKIDIAANPEVVWGLIGDFAKISNWNPAVTSSKANIDPDQGQERILTLKNGSNITDVQTDYDATKMTYPYRRVDDDVKALPVSFYSATITVTPTATGSEVDWPGRFYRGDTSNEPPPVPLGH
jgi:mxaD protein